MNKVFNALTNPRKSERFVMPRARRPFILAFNTENEQIWRTDTSRETQEDDCKRVFEENPDAVLINVCYLNGRSKVVRRPA